MDFLVLHENNETHRVYNYRNKILKRKRNDSTGNYELYKQFFTDDSKRRLKNIYGGNGDISNISSSFLLKFPNAKYSDVSQNVSLKGQLLSVFKTFDSTGVLSAFEIDTNAPNETELSIYINVSWESSDSNAETQANALITAVKDSTSLTNILAALPVPAPFDVVQLDTSLDAITVDNFVIPTIHSLVTTYNSGPDNTDIEVKTVGLYDHIGIKINSESDNEYRRLRTNGVKTLNISGVNPDEDIIIATLFNHDYKPLYTSIQSPIVFVQQTQGTNGDILNEAVDGSITLDLDHNDFITNNQSDFITTMNAQTGGITIVINVYAGSAIVEYRVIFDVLKTQQEIDAVVTKLNNDTEVQNIINTSATMNGVTSVKTVGTTTEKKGQVLTLMAGITDVKYDGANTKIVFHTIGSYKNILYKATGQGTFLSSTSKSVDLPPGFTNQIDVKLTNVNDGDITTVATYTVDTVIPVITLIGSSSLFLELGNAYVEQGANVTDNSGETINAVITGTVDINTVGAYVLSYNASDSSGNAAVQVQRTVNVLTQVILQEFIGGSIVLNNQTAFENFVTFNGGAVVLGTDIGVSDAKFALAPINGTYAFKTWFGNSPFQSDTNLTQLILPGCTHLGHDTFRNCTNLTTIDGPIVTTIANQCFQNCPAITTINLPLVTYIGNTCFTGIAATSIVLPKLESWDNTSSIKNNASCTTLDLRGISSTTWPNGIGNTGGSTNVFDGYPNNGTGYFTAYLETSNGGGVDGDIQVLVGKGWTIIYPDVIPPVITLIGNNPFSVLKGNSYVEPGANVTDNSGETPTPVITGTVDTNTVGSYIISYNASDSSGNAATQVQRTVYVVDPINYYDIESNNISVFNYNTDTLTQTFTTNPYKLQIDGGMWAIDPSKLVGHDITQPWTIMFKTIKTGGPHFVTVFFNAIITSPYNIPTHADNDTYRISFTPGNGEYKHYVGLSNIFDSDAGTGFTTSFEIVDSEAIWSFTYDGTDIAINIVDANGNAISQPQSFSTVAGQVTMTNGRHPVAVYLKQGTTHDFFNSVLFAANNTTTISDYITNSDAIPPVITLNGGNPHYILINTSYTEPGATAVDNLDGSVSVNISGTVDGNTLGDYIISYDAVDSGGNNAIQVQRTVKVVNSFMKLIEMTDANTDNSPEFSGSTITFNNDDTITVYQYIVISPTRNALDIVYNNDWKVITKLNANSSEFRQIFNVDLTQYSNNHPQDAGTKRFTLHDSGVVEGSQITVNSNAGGWSGNDIYIEHTYTLSTNTLKFKMYKVSDLSVLYDIDIAITFIDSVDRIPFAFVGKRPGQTINYLSMVRDWSGSTLTVNNYPQYSDITPPVITLIGDSNITLNQGESYVEQGANAVDDVDGSVSVNISGTVDVNTLGAYIISYDAVDNSGNNAIQVQRTINVVTPPFTHVGGSLAQNVHWYITDKNQGATWVNPGDPEYDPSSIDYTNGFSFAFTVTANDRLSAFLFTGPTEGIGMTWYQFGVLVKDTDSVSHNLNGNANFFNGGPNTFLLTITPTGGNLATANLYKNQVSSGSATNIAFNPANVSRDNVLVPGTLGQFRSTSTTITNIRLWNYPVDYTTVT